MDRRQFLATLPATLAAAPPARPNLLFLFSDSHRACSMPGEPHCDVEAPNLRRLAGESMSFRNCVSNYPVCSPHRAMLLTGRWPYQTGIIDNSINLRDDEVSLGRVFRRGAKNPAPLFRGVRTARHTYAVASDGAWCLFDNREDPYQTHDLLDDARGKRIASDLDGVTMDWLRKSGDPFPFDELRKSKSPRAGKRSPGA